MQCWRGKRETEPHAVNGQTLFQRQLEPVAARYSVPSPAPKVSDKTGTKAASADSDQLWKYS